MTYTGQGLQRQIVANLRRHGVIVDNNTSRDRVEVVSSLMNLGIVRQRVRNGKCCLELISDEKASRFLCHT